MGQLLHQNMIKVDQEVSLHKDMLNTLNEQNQALESMKNKFQDFLHSDQYLSIKLIELNKLLKFKIKKEKDLRLYKLDCFVKNIA